MCASPVAVERECARPSSARSRRRARSPAPARTPRRRSSPRSSRPPRRCRRRCAPRARRCESRRRCPAGRGRGTESRRRRARADSHGNRAPARPSLRRGCARSVEPAEPVLEHRPCGRRMRSRRGTAGRRRRCPRRRGRDKPGRSGRGPRPQPRRLGGRPHQVEEREAHERCSSSSPSILMSAVSQRSAQRCRCSDEQAVEARPSALRRSRRQCFLRVGHR